MGFTDIRSPRGVAATHAHSRFRRRGLRSRVSVGIALAACTAFATSCAGAGAGGSAAYYEGDVVEFMIPYSPGGGTSEIATVMSPYLTKYIPGKPKVQPINEPAGGSLVGANRFAREAKGGTDNMLLFTSSNLHHHFMFDAPGVEYDLTKYEPLLGTPAGWVLYASPSTGLRKATDLQDPKRQLVYGGVSYGGAELGRLLSLELLGTDVKFVGGYEGRGDTRVAFEQGEVNLDAQTTAAYIQNVEPLAKKKKAVPLFTSGTLDASGEVVRDPAFPDIPHVGEVYESIHGKAPSGVAWESYKVVLGYSNVTQKVVWMPKDIPADAKADLRKGFSRTVDDADFEKAAAEELGGYEFQVGADAKKAAERFKKPDEEIVTYLTDFLKKKYDVELSKAG